MPTQTPARETAGDRPPAATATARLSAYGPSELLQAGAVAGLVAGLGFILANMIYATSQGLPAIAPFLAIGTIFFIDDMPQMTPAYALAGVITHFSLSILFGMVFAFLVPLFPTIKALAVGAIGYGLALYVVNFLVLGNLIFEWFAPGDGGPDQIYELIVHPAVYGVLLIPFFAGMVKRGTA